MPASLSTAERRRALRLGVVSGALWSIGNGWTTGTLVSYFAQELGAKGLHVGTLLSWQALLGLVRFAAPAVIRRLGGIKSATIALLSIAYGLLAAIPILAIEEVSLASRLRIFLAILCVHQLFEHLGSVALWSWLAELTPARLRGRYFAARQRWQLAALIPTSVAAALFVDWWRGATSLATAESAVIVGYVVVLSAGGLVLLVSVVPLLAMPAVSQVNRQRREVQASSSGVDWRFARFLFCGCWLSFFNGVAQSALNIYPKRVLGLGLVVMIALPLAMRVGQMVLAPSVGRFSDRYGNRPTIFLCQACVAFGPMFYLLATRAHPGWLAGAYLVWSAFVGLNVCLPNLIFRLAPTGQVARYTAIYFALTGLAYGASTFCGGWLFDLLRDQTFAWGPLRLDVFAYFFLVSWIGRLLGLAPIAWLSEPGAWTWRQIVRHWHSRTTSPAVIIAPASPIASQNKLR